MDATATLGALAREMDRELTGRILPYWRDVAVDPGGGFHGFIGPDNIPVPGAPRGAILNCRILWTFSAAYRALGGEDLRRLADRAAAVVLDRFMDPEHGGVYWTIDAAGRPLEDRKHVYAQAFAVYALAEHHRATHLEASRDAAIGLYRLVEEHAADHELGGYLESFDRDWRPRPDDRLSAVDLAAPKSQNTHLHVLEAYAGLARAWSDPGPRARLAELIELFLDRIIKDGHTRPFFDRDWTVSSAVVSFGHDIETSWLLQAAAAAVGDPALADRAAAAARGLALRVLEEGLDPRGGVYYAVDEGGTLDREKEWWPQAEAVVGFLNAWQGTGEETFLAAARDTWVFIRKHLRDLEGGEWFRRADRDGTPQAGHEKLGPWKGPYHGVRACLEVMGRAGALPGGPPNRSTD